MTIKFAERMGLVGPSAIRELMKLGSDPNVISFGGGYPNPTLFPSNALAEIFYSLIKEDGRTALQYSEATGLPRLRAQIAELMVADGVACSSSNVLILQGAQQGLDLVAKLLLNKGDLVITEDPTFLGAMIAFNPYEPRYVAVKMDESGIDTDILEESLKREVPKFLYTVPDFQNPTGITMSSSRRHRLIELANEYEFLILEDSPYRRIRFRGQHLPSLSSIDTQGRVIHLGSFSKTLAPAFRLGWAAACPDIIDKLAMLKLAADTQCSTLTMAAVSRFIDEHDFDHHVSNICSVYREKKDCMLRAIKQRFPSEIIFTDPEGGLFTWLTFPRGFDTGRFMLEHALPEAKVAYVPGAAFFPDGVASNHARLSFATQSDDIIERGVAALGDVLKRQFDRA